MRTVLAQIGVLVLLSTLSIVEGITIITDNAGTYGANLAGWYVIGLGSILALMTVLHIFNNRDRLKVLRTATQPKQDADQVGQQRRVWLLLLLVAVYIISIDFIGYTLSTVLFFIIFLRFLGGYCWGKTVMYSLLFGVIFGFVFMQVGMALPTGFFG